MGRRLATVGCALALGLGVAACGDDDGDGGGTTGATPAATSPGATTPTPATTTPTETLTKAEWIEKADAICTQAEAQAEALEPEGEDPQVIATAIRGLVPLFEKQRADLDALGAPEEIASQVDETLGLLGEQQALLPRIADAVEANDEAAAREATQAGDDIETRLDALAKEIGLKECGSD